MTEKPAAPLGERAEPKAGARGRGLGLVFVAGILYASAGLFTRGLAYDAWTLLAWRSLAAALFLLGLVAFEKRRLDWRDYSLSPAQWVLLPIGAVATACYVFALTITSIANVMIAYATSPFVTAIVAWLWVGEVPDRRILVASGIALLGVGVMIAGQPASTGSLLGTALILFMNVSFALTLVLARRDPHRSMTPVNALSLVLASAAGFALAPLQAIGPGALLAMVLFGVVTVGFAMSMFMAGARLAPSSEVALIGIADVVIGPLMVWAVFDEVPTGAAVLGGALVSLALLWSIWPALAQTLARRRRQRLPFDKASGFPD